MTIGFSPSTTNVYGICTRHEIEISRNAGNRHALNCYSIWPSVQLFPNTPILSAKYVLHFLLCVIRFQKILDTDLNVFSSANCRHIYLSSNRSCYFGQKSKFCWPFPSTIKIWNNDHWVWESIRNRTYPCWRAQFAGKTTGFMG